MEENTTESEDHNVRLTGNLEFRILPELNLITQYTYQTERGSVTLINPAARRQVAGTGEIKKATGEKHIARPIVKNSRYAYHT